MRSAPGHAARLHAAWQRCTGARWKLPGAMRRVLGSAAPTLQAQLERMECLGKDGFTIFTCDSSKCSYAFCAGAAVKP